MYLMVGGGILFTFEVLVVLAHLTPCDADDKIVLGLLPIVTLTMFAVTIWGSVVVFGPYSEWVYEEADKSNDNYCEYTPFMFAFVTLILEWVFIPVMVLLVCCLSCAGFCIGLLAK